MHVQRVHENKKSFKCDLCEYSTFQLAALKKHIECVHENLKQHQCKIVRRVLATKEF
jgi:hypothetical protein